MRRQPRTIHRPFEYTLKYLNDVCRAFNLPKVVFEDVVESAPRSYSTFRRPKRTGGFRVIRPPGRTLRIVQRRVYRRLTPRVRYPRWMVGGVPGRSTITHAKPHAGRHMVITMDIESFFPSVKEDQVRSVLERFGIEGPALDAMVRLTTLEGCLPQGAPTSCFLANLVFDPIDRRIDAICRKHKINYSRYVDDIALSSDKDIRSFRGAINDAVEAEGFRIAKDKTTVMGREREQIVTNLCVNQAVRPCSRFIDELEDTIWTCLQEHGPAMLALEEGISIRKLKLRVLGQVEYVRQFDIPIGERFSKKCKSIIWYCSVYDQPKTFRDHND